jgi:antitoxin component of MazEF toxin-antitoxin module
VRNTQRICKHGSCTVVTIPRQFMYALNWICGQGVIVELLEDGKGVLVRQPRLEDFGPVIPPRLFFDQTKTQV